MLVDGDAQVQLGGAVTAQLTPLRAPEHEPQPCHPAAPNHGAAALAAATDLDETAPAAPGAATAADVDYTAGGGHVHRVTHDYARRLLALARLLSRSVGGSVGGSGSVGCRSNAATLVEVGRHPDGQARHTTTRAPSPCPTARSRWPCQTARHRRSRASTPPCKGPACTCTPGLPRWSVSAPAAPRSRCRSRAPSSRRPSAAERRWYAAGDAIANTEEAAVRQMAVGGVVELEAQRPDRVVAGHGSFASSTSSRLSSSRHVRPGVRPG